MSIFKIIKRHLYILILLIVAAPLIAYFLYIKIYGGYNYNPEKFTIGLILPYETRNEYDAGLEMALEEINLDGGILGKHITIEKYVEPEDFRSEMRVALNSVLDAMHKFALNKSLIGVVSVARSMSAVSSAPILQQKGKILITASATDPVINKMGFDNLFSTQFSDEDTASVIVHHAAEKKLHRFVVIGDDSLSAANLTSRFLAELTYSGGEVLYKEMGHHDRDRFEKSLLFILDNPMFKLEDVDAILIVARSPIEYMYAVSRMRQLNIYQPIYAPRSIISLITLQEFRENKIDDIYVITPYDRYYPAPQTELFLSKFLRKFSKPPTLADEEVYTGLKILAFGMNNSKSTNSLVVSNYLRSMRYVSTFQSPSGNLAFDPTGRITDSDIFVLKFSEDRFISVARYLKPFHWKTSKDEISADININLQ